jgi:hypothetical protein
MNNDNLIDQPITEPLPQPTPGQGGVVMLGLAIGILLMGIQLWLLTLAFDLYLSGKRSETVIAAVISGLAFLGGVAMLRLLDRGPQQRA